ncbi:hypothetical protein DPV78_001607 [Talaromyces pinophilus]|jgi:hypothetical protein|nr:hypothetical protein DPV78_001607 [Talaromyces pinophilus]
MWRGDGEEEFIQEGEEREKRQVKKGWRCYEQKRTQVTLAGGTLKPELEPAVFYGLREPVLKFTSFSPVARQVVRPGMRYPAGVARSSQSEDR